MSDDESKRRTIGIRVWQTVKPHVPSIVLNMAVFGGLAMLGIGLWWYEPWVSMAVIGFILFGGACWSMNRPIRNTSNIGDNE